MVAPTGATPRPDRLRAVSGLQPLKQPRPVAVETGESGEPVAVVLSGRRLAVERVEDVWRIDDEWWRQRPISRVYYVLFLEDGRVVTVYQDMQTLKWCLQRY